VALEERPLHSSCASGDDDGRPRRARRNGYDGRARRPADRKPEDPLRLLANSFNAVAPNFLPRCGCHDPWVPATGRNESVIAAMRETAVWANGITVNRPHPYGLREDSTRRCKPPPALPTDRVTAQSIQPNIDVAAKYGFLQATFPARIYQSVALK